jgi:RHS repeat-associated protein
MAYDHAGNLTSVTDPLGNHATYHYDANGNLDRSTDARTNQTLYSYDADGEATGVAQPDGSSQGYAYDRNGNLLSQAMIAADGTTLRTLSYQYDPLNRVKLSIDPENRQTLYTYDGAGNLKTVQDAMGRTSSYGYDELKQLTSVGYNDPPSGGYPGTHDLGFTYTADGLRSSMSDATGTSQYTYDSLNRLMKVVNGANQETDYGYDSASNLTTLTYPAIGSGSTVQVQRTYDAVNRMTDVIDWNGNDTHFTYDADGNLSGQTYPTSTNGTQAIFSYDHADELKKIIDSRTSGANPFRWTFGYGRDPLGQVSTSTDRLTGIRHGYTYDARNRLTQDTRSNRTATSWSYDATDNLKTSTDTASGITKSYGYDAANSQLMSLQTSGSSTQTISYGYNPNGDRIAATGAVSTSDGYNQADELISFTQGTTSASYRYDGDGLRASKTVGSSTEGYVWDMAEGMPVILQDGATRSITGPGGLPIEQVDGSGTVQYFVQDQLGSTRGLLDASGNVVGTYTFGAYGNLLGHGGTASTPFGYAGQYTDGESGLQSLRARYYDPGSQRFLTVDPMLGATGEPYSYADGDPVNTYGPTGFGTTGSAAGTSGGIATGVGAAVAYEYVMGHIQVSWRSQSAYSSVPGQVKFGKVVGNGFNRSFHVDKHVGGNFTYPHWNAERGMAPEFFVRLSRDHAAAPEFLFRLTSVRGVKALVGASGIAGAGLDAVALATAPQCELGQTVGGIIGAYAGNLAGAGLGSMFWIGPGTIAGSVIGGAVGYGIGAWIGSQLDNACC